MFYLCDATAERSRVAVDFTDVPERVLLCVVYVCVVVSAAVFVLGIAVVT